jgi:hypothetical protein
MNNSKISKKYASILLANFAFCLNICLVTIVIQLGQSSISVGDRGKSSGRLGKPRG